MKGRGGSVEGRDRARQQPQRQRQRINWDGGDFTATQTNNLLVLAGGNTRVDRLEIDSSLSSSLVQVQ